MFCQHPLRILLQQIFLYPPLEDCPLRFHAWDKERPDDPDGIFILDRLRFGFKLIPESDPSCIVAYESDNYSSATCPDFKPEMDSLFTKELTLGRISMVLTKPRCVHPIGRVPKKDSGKSRPITDCSRPHGISLNDHIKRDLQSFCMNSIDSAVSFSTPYCFYSIVVMESAWRWIPVSSPPPPPAHRELQSFRWSLAHTTLPSIIITWTTDFVSVSRAHRSFSTVSLTLLFA